MSAPDVRASVDRVVGTGRRRDWWVVLCLLLAVGLYWTVWTQYTRIHTITRYVAATPGAAAERNGQTLRVVSAVRTTTLLSKYESQEPQVAPAGGEFVVAVVALTVAQDTEYPDCGPTLLGPDDRTWEPITIADVSRVKESLCTDVKAGQTVEIENIYEVPCRYADQLVGFAWDDPSSPDRVVVLSPPR